MNAPPIPPSSTAQSLLSQQSENVSSSPSDPSGDDEPLPGLGPISLLESFRVWYMSYMLALMGLGAIAMKCLCSQRSFMEYLFLSVSAASCTGLTTMDMAMQPLTTQIIVWLVIVLGSPVLLSLVPVLVRWGFSMRQPNHGRAAFFGMQTSDTDERAALEIIMIVVVSYCVTLITLGWLGLWFSLREHPDGNAWSALFLSTSAFNNAGLVILDGGLSIHDQRAPMTLSIVMLLILGGNTFFPMALRCILQVVRHFTTNPHKRRVLRLLLRYPRACYTHLFPAYANRWLLTITPLLIGVQVFALVLIAIVGDPVVRHENAFLSGLTKRETTWAVLFSSVSTRTAGFSVLDLAELTPTSAFVFCVCMWISASPVVVVMRTTAVSVQETLEISVSEKDFSQKQKTGRKQEMGVVQKQLTTFMTDHIVVLLCLMFGILLFEEFHVTDLIVSQEFLSIVFEFCSAYGNVGLSMTVGATSLCSNWRVGTRVLLMAVMFLGRLRALPESIDPTFRFVRSWSDPEQTQAGALACASSEEGSDDDALYYERAVEGGMTPYSRPTSKQSTTYGSFP